ncbi:MAG: hypothetical protein ACD_39C01534G0003 [uncultured bacterium]|nr:MAG: hypothetical protein ACD_39C01534G0003 [uncultured bacterium]
MLNNKDLQKIFIRVALASFVITLLIAVPYISRRMPKEDAPARGNSSVIRYGLRPIATPAAGNSDASGVLNTGRASEKQVKPSFGNLPNELFPGNRPFSLDFHKLPVDYLEPQQPEVTRAAISQIRQLQIADLAALEAQQAMAKNYDKSPAEDGGAR